MHRSLAFSLIALVGLLSGACSSMPTSPTGPSSTQASVSGATTDGTAGLGADMAFCVDEINRYRTSVGRPPLARSQSLETFATDAAQKDAGVRIAHQHFRDTNGAGVSQAETEILWWKDQPVHDVVQKGLAQMWRVGPGGEHYDIISGPYTQVGCGAFISNGEVTVSQDFR